MNPSKSWLTEDLPPVSGPFSADQIKDTVLILHKMAVEMRRRRQESGALRLDQPKLSFTLDTNNQFPTGCSVCLLFFNVQTS